MKYLGQSDSEKQYCSFNNGSYEEPQVEKYKKLINSKTLYVGNLSYYTTEGQIEEIFSKCGNVRRVILGLDRFQKTPCGFCFVEYYDRAAAENGMRFIDGTVVDERIVRIDWDTGFVEGRQYGRGTKGGQVRDDFRKGYDPGRGGFGASLELL